MKALTLTDPQWCVDCHKGHDRKVVHKRTARKKKN
jgi:hypothetical protein